MNRVVDIISIQNKILLSNIADQMFDNDLDKNIFIEKYHKYNFHVVKVSKNKNLLNHSFKRIVNINKLRV